MGPGRVLQHFCPSKEKCALNAARQGGRRPAKAPGAGSCPVEPTEAARLGTYAPRHPGKVSEHPMAPGVGSEAGAARVNQARSCGGNQSPTGGDRGDQGRPTLPAGGADHVTGSRAPELRRPPGPSLLCDHMPPLDRVPPARTFPWPLGREGGKGQLSCSGHSLGRLSAEEAYFIALPSLHSSGPVGLGLGLDQAGSLSLQNSPWGPSL